jgi:hypothetical protein
MINLLDIKGIISKIVNRALKISNVYSNTLEDNKVPSASKQKALIRGNFYFFIFFLPKKPNES